MPGSPGITKHQQGVRRTLMTKFEYRRKLSAIRKAESAWVDEMIAAGRGTEKPSETARMTDQLAVAYRNLSARNHALECAALSRWGSRWKFYV